MKWDDVKKELKSITPEESKALEDLARYQSAGLVTDEEVWKAIDEGTEIALRDRLDAQIRANVKDPDEL